MEFFASLGDKVEVHTTRISLIGVEYSTATLAAKRLDWLQQHINKTGGKKVDVSFIVGKDESARVWKLLKGDAPDPLQA
ncbi:hypothetical protein [Pseudomonas sp. P8_250]|uniref:hypothetical protein n=1 Tax=Pseudomonas sp. P8_250 TaxID=3043446 RepID=UPI002A35C4AC|nr:hypothetical protein [Pseudomonas sp. P8_250]MDX9668681.1 hypothetical protein [Pseudomonas sp. P8_250]